MSKIPSVIEARAPMWSVIFYAPNNVRKELFRSGQRGEAEAAKQRYQRLIGSEFKLEIVFEEARTIAA